MASLAKCIEIHKLSKFEADKLQASAKAYRDEGYAGKDANIGAVKDAIRDLESERADILRQIGEKIKEAEKQTKPGKAWINDQQRPIYAVKTLKDKRNKGKVVVTLDMGKVKKIDESKIIEWPGAPVKRFDVGKALTKETDKGTALFSKRTFKPSIGSPVRLHLPGDKHGRDGITGKIEKKSGNTQWQIKLDNRPGSMVLSENEFTVISSEAYQHPSPEENTRLVDEFINSKRGGKITVERPEAGERIWRVIWDSPTVDMTPNTLSDVNLADSDDTFPELRSIHVTHDPEYWRDKLKEDYGRDARSHIIEIETMEGDAITSDPQYAIPDEDGHVAHSAILVTSRKVLKRQKIPGERVFFQRRTFKPVDVESPEFKRWFKESAATEDGKPVVVYHSGSFRAEEDGGFIIDEDGGIHFGTEDAARARIGGKAVDEALSSIETFQTDDGTWSYAIDGVEYGDGFETEDEAYADAEEMASQTEASDEDYDESSITPVYLSIQNPKVVTDQGTEWTETIKKAKKEGHDGIIYTNQYEDKGSFSYIAFSPTQIKSAVSNTGEFSSSDPRIQFSRRQLDEINAYDDALYVHEYPSTYGKGPLSDEQKRVRKLGYGIKSLDPDAVKEVAGELADLIPGDKSKAILIPIPGHTGETASNLAIANRIAKITGAKVKDVLKRQVGPSQRDQRLAGRRTMRPEEFGMVSLDNGRVFVKNERYSEKRGEDGPFHDAWVLSDKNGNRVSQLRFTSESSAKKGADRINKTALSNVYFVDNVISSGATIRAARDAVGGGRGLVYAKANPKGTKFQMRTPAVTDFITKWENKGVNIAVTETDKSLDLLTLIVPENMRGKGAGTDFLNELVKLSDRTGKPIELLASEPGTAKAAAAEKLKDFYGHFGFEVTKEEPDGSGYWMGRWPANIISGADIQSLTPREKNVLTKQVKLRQNISNPTDSDLADFLDDAISDNGLRNGFIDRIFNKIGGETDALYLSKRRDPAQPTGRGLARRRLQEGLKEWGYRNTDTIFVKALGLTKKEKDVQKIAKALGFDLYYFKTTDPGIDLINGVVLSNYPDVVYVNSNTPNPLIQVTGHEFVHFLKRIHPDLYYFLDDCLKRNVVDFKTYLDKLKKDFPDYPFTKERGKEELYGDFIGDQWTKPEFWKKLNQENPSLTRRLADFINSIIEKIKRAVKRYIPTSEKYFKDIDYAQDVIAKVMSEAALRAEKAYEGSTRGNVSLDENELFIPGKYDEVNPIENIQVVDRKTAKDTPSFSRRTKDDLSADALLERYFGKQAVQPMPAALPSDIKPQRAIDIEKETGKSKVAFEPKHFDLSKEGVKNLAVKAYTSFFMQEYPVKRFFAKAGPEAEKAGEEQIRRMRGAGGITEAILTANSKTPFIELAKDGVTEYSHLGETSLQKILKPLNNKKLYQDYERLREAERDLALSVFRKDDIEKGKLKGIDPDNSQKVISLLKAKYGANGFKGLRDISREHTRFEQDAVLKTLLKSGWMSQESYDAITDRPESEFYASYLREMEDVEKENVGSGGDPVKRIYGSEKRKIPSTEGTIGNILRTVRLVEKLRLNKAVVAIKDLSPELEKMITEKKPRFKAVTITFPKRDASNKFIKDADGKRVYQTKKVAVPVGPPANTITIAEDGKKKYYELPSDVMKAIDNYSPKSVNVAIKLMSYLTRLLRAGATLSFEFIVRNPVRDQFSAFVYSKYGYNPTDFVKGIFHAIRMDDLYKEFKASGGENSFFVSLDREAVNLRARDMTGIGNKIKYVKNPVEALRILSEFSEKGTRVGLYAKARKKGATIQEAMTEAREGTLDFGRIGTEKAMNQIIAFWNANLQGTDKLFRERKNGKAMMRAVMGITIPSIALWMLNHDDDRYKELPAWRKNFFWNIIIDDWPIISIPKPFELGIIFGSLPERILDWIFLNDPESMKDIAVAVGEAATPGLIPTAALPIIEHITNYSFFRGQRLEPQSMENLPNWMRYGSGTTELAKKAGRLIDVSPLKIENWVRDWTGSLGYSALSGFDKLFMGDDIPDVGKNWYEIAPGIKGFVSREPIGSGSKSVEQFYENAKEVLSADAGAKFLSKSADPEEFQKFAKKQRSQIAVATGARKALDQMSMVRQNIQKIINAKNVSSAEKRKQIDKLNELITKRAQAFNKVYDKIVKE